MKLEDCKRGMLILATKKSCTAIYSMEAFLKTCPLGVARITSVEEKWVNLTNKDPVYGIEVFTFLPEDLILLQETNESK